jgi:hypothetical protein
LFLTKKTKFVLGLIFKFQFQANLKLSCELWRNPSLSSNFLSNVCDKGYRNSSPSFGGFFLMLYRQVTLGVESILTMMVGAQAQVLIFCVLLISRCWTTPSVESSLMSATRSWAWAWVHFMWTWALVQKGSKHKFGFFFFLFLKLHC